MHVPALHRSGGKRRHPTRDRRLRGRGSTVEPLPKVADTVAATAGAAAAVAAEKWMGSESHTIKKRNVCILHFYYVSCLDVLVYKCYLTIWQISFPFMFHNNNNNAYVYFFE